MDHGADRGPGIIGPEHPQVFLGLVMISDPVVIFLGESLAVSEPGGPAEHGVAQIKLMNEHFAGRFTSVSDQSRRLVNCGIVAPAALDDEIAMPARAGRGLGCCR